MVAEAPLDDTVREAVRQKEEADKLMSVKDAHITELQEQNDFIEKEIIDDVGRQTIAVTSIGDFADRISECSSPRDASGPKRPLPWYKKKQMAAYCAKMGYVRRREPQYYCVGSKVDYTTLLRQQQEMHTDLEVSDTKYRELLGKCEDLQVLSRERLEKLCEGVPALPPLTSPDCTASADTPPPSKATPQETQVLPRPKSAPLLRNNDFCSLRPARMFPTRKSLPTNSLFVAGPRLSRLSRPESLNHVDHVYGWTGVVTKGHEGKERMQEFLRNEQPTTSALLRRLRAMGLPAGAPPVEQP